MGGWDAEHAVVLDDLYFLQKRPEKTKE